MIICYSPRLWLDNCAIVQDHRRRLERGCLSRDKSLQEVRWVIVLVHLLLLLLVSHGEDGRWTDVVSFSEGRILFSIQLPICTGLDVEHRASTLSNHPFCGVVEHWLLGVEEGLLVDSYGEALVCLSGVWRGGRPPQDPFEAP